MLLQLAPAVAGRRLPGPIALGSGQPDAPLRFAAHARSLIWLDGDEARLATVEPGEADAVASNFGFPMGRFPADLLRRGESLFPGILGYDDTVIPAVENALLCGHDLIFLGERGQAKSRMIRDMVGLLDEWMPEVEGSEIHDDPFAPVSAMARASPSLTLAV